MIFHCYQQLCYDIGFHVYFHEQLYSSWYLLPYTHVNVLFKMFKNKQIVMQNLLFIYMPK